MADSNGATQDISANSFKEDFGTLQPLILKEWPSVDGSALAATGGDLDRVVTLVAEKTEHTKALVRRQLAELREMGLKGRARAQRADARFREVLDRLEKRTTELAKEIRGPMMENARGRLRENVFVSLLAALGLGFLLGAIIGLIGGRGSK